MTKPAVVPAVALAARSGGGSPSRTLDVALAGSWAGDVALLSRSEAGLLGGVGGFAAAHLAYLAEIRRFAAATAAAAHGPVGAGRRERAVLAAYGGVFAAAAAVLWRRLDTPAERRLRGPVLGYAALVTGHRRGRDPGRAAPRRAGRPGARRRRHDLRGVRRAGGAEPLRPAAPSRAVEAAVMVTYAAAQGLLAAALTEPPTTGPDAARSADEDDLEGAGAVHALDAVQLDVAGRGRPADPGQRAGRVEAGDRLRHGLHDLVGADHAEVLVRAPG